MEIKAELISIGNELLNGRTLNTHGQDLGAALTAIGLRLMRDTTIPDDIAIIQGAVRDALDRTELVFVSGGLGPTVDDITRDALAGLLDRNIILDQPSVDAMAERYAARGRTMTAAAERQALVLEGAVVLPNSVGAAPGMRIDLDNKALFILPGPPHEFNAILEEKIMPWLKERYADAWPMLVRTVPTKGIGESDIVTILENAGFDPGDEVELGFYPGMGRVEIRLTARPGFEVQIDEAAHALRTLLTDHLDPEA